MNMLINTTPLRHPKTSTMPMLILLTELAPVANSNGIAPAAVDRQVIIIGLNLILAASIAAWTLSIPDSSNCLANSTIRMPCFADNPISISIAI